MPTRRYETRVSSKGAADAAPHHEGDLGADPDGLRQNNPTGKISLSPSGKSLLGVLHPVPEEGALAIVTERWDGMRWTRQR